ncbi:MAG: hypothetical protein F4207_03875 [Gemmatimonadetes bacterium]|nr:hypothetical protein [Gemmatimonadota bacterium]MYG15556.1 hypothetical protein [Gemmatimonadota bacterium]
MNRIERLETNEPILIVKLNQKYRPGMSSEELYEISRQYWVVGPRREEAKYLVPAYRGRTIEAYFIENWYPVKYQGKTRWAIIGVVANEGIRDQLVRKSIWHLQAQGAANPVRYLNC